MWVWDAENEEIRPAFASKGEKGVSWQAAKKAAMSHAINKLAEAYYLLHRLNEETEATSKATWEIK